MNPTTPVSLQGYRHRASRAICPWIPGNAHSVRRAAEAAAALSGSDLDPRQARPPLRRVATCTSRTTGRSAHMRTPSRPSTRTSAALPALDNFVLGQLARFQTAINPEGYPGGTLRHAGQPAELHQLQPLQRVRALCERQLEHRQPRDAESRPPLRVLRSAEQERAEVSTRTSTTATRTCR